MGTVEIEERTHPVTGTRDLGLTPGLDRLVAQLQEERRRAAVERVDAGEVEGDVAWRGLEQAVNLAPRAVARAEGQLATEPEGGGVPPVDTLDRERKTVGDAHGRGSIGRAVCSVNAGLGRPQTRGLRPVVSSLATAGTL